ncbi:hypothetical protein AB0X98_01540 [Rothia koreensis]|uniref:hypothetical protein n=1 Tax=Rothia koreensis TaxID=592378 RepID=UPI003F1E9AE3
MSHANYLTSEQLCRALRRRDLTDVAQGPHAVQTLPDAAVTGLRSESRSTGRYVRAVPGSGSRVSSSMST